LLSVVEQARLQISKSTDAKKKSQFGQFLTPATTAAFMAGLFPSAEGDCRLLDAGAGIGSLCAAFLERWRSGGLPFRRVELDAFEIDDSLHAQLTETLSRYGGENCSLTVRSDDFIHAAADSISGGLFAKQLPKYSHVILNPPYKKIRGHSAHRLALRSVGIETVNLYSAFVALAVALTAPGGQLVAIVPRSFCNGPYYRPFRDFMLEHTAIRHMHLFESRSKAFKDDDVLQENIIVRLERDGACGPVTISTSTDDSFGDLIAHEYPFERIVFADDPHRFIHVPTSPEKNAIELSPDIRYSLDDLGLKISTGPVVDFRLKEHLRDMPGPHTAPLLYPAHFNGRDVAWPLDGFKKFNAIERNADTEKWLYPNGFYCVVRRFSAKEEARRVVASVVDPTAFDGATLLGFENHLNLFHQDKRGLPETLARGLAVYLNSTAVDENFRRFNGHTQVNATDLKQMKYPSRDVLVAMGEWSKGQGEFSQAMIDERLRNLTA
jgi:adenine-specific DNA-methyltransferase